MLFYYKTMQKQNVAILEISDSQRSELITNTFDVSSQRFFAVLHENSAWDDLQDFVASEKRDVEWAYDNIGTMSETMLAADVAILDLNGNVLYNNPSKDFKNMNLYADLKFQVWTKSAERKHFYQYSGNKLMEYFCQGIVSSSDIITRKENPTGYLFIVREVSDSLLNSYSKSLGGMEIQCQRKKNVVDEIHAQNPNKFVADFQLNDHFGHPVSYLCCIDDNKILLIFAGFAPAMVIFGVIVVVTFIFFLIFIRFRIISPLKKITDTFSTEDLSKIKSLKKNRTEFGVLSVCLDKFIVQKQKLEQMNVEMEQKQQELLAQNDQLEMQKKEIENQIANANVLNQQIIASNKETERRNVQISVQNELLTAQAEKLKQNQISLDNFEYKLKHANAQLETVLKEVTDSQSYSSQLRNVLMVASTPAKHILNDFMVFQMLKDKVGGDFVFAKKIDKWVVAAVGNCNLEGIPGALVSALDIYLLNEVVDFSKSSEMSPNLLLNSLNKKIVAANNELSGLDETNDGLHISLFVINTETMRGYFSAAKRTIVLIRKGEDIEYFGDNLSVGKITDDKQFRCIEMDLMPEDTIYLYSDGCTDVVGGPYCKKLSPLNFKRQLVKSHLLSFQQQKNEIKHFYEDWIGELELSNDVTILGFKI